MIAQLIHASIRHRSWVLLAAVALTLAGLWSVKHTNLDALPDLSDTQVVLRISWPGQAPQIVEDQVTYPLATTMMSVPEVANVRAYSFLGDAFIYVLFNDEIDLYWARTRVLEYLSQVQGKLPEGAEITLGPDASGLGWIYEYALVDRTGQHDLGSLTSLQNWFLRYRLKTVPDVAEVATIGGMEQAWQVVVDPNRLASHRLQVSDVSSAINSANGAASGSVIEQGEASLMVRSVGYLQSFDDFAAVPVGLDDNNHPILLGDIATLRRGPTMRQGMAELDGEGAVVGAVVILRSGRNALTTIDAVKERINELERSLPEGVEIIPTYDRSELIHAAIDNLTQKLLEEFIVIALACLLFL